MFEIERLSRMRHDIWAGRERAGEGVGSLTTRLADLFEVKRAAIAQRRDGDRATIIQRAKAETELERLMSD
jgi:hypothetical protein